MTVTVCIPSIPGRDAMLDEACASVHAQTVHAAAISIATDTRRQGAAVTRNRALFDVDTEWVAFLDDDDLLLPQHLERLLATAVETGADLVYPWFELDRPGYDRTAADPWLACPDGLGNLVSPFGVPFGPIQRDHILHTANFIPVTYLVRTEVAKSVGGFPIPGSPDWPHPECEDWGFHKRLLNAGAAYHHLAERTWVWRHHGQNTSGRADLATAMYGGPHA